MNCEGFHDHLPGFLRGSLSEEEGRQLLAHAECCTDCRAVLELEEGLLGEAPAALEARVPDALVDGLWPAVRAQLPPPRRRSAAPRWRRALVPSLSAAVVLLLVLSGYLLGELRGRRDFDRLERPALEATGSPPFAPAPRVGEVRAWLRSLPPDRTVLTAEQLGGLRAGGVGWRALAQQRAASGRGVSAAELLELLESLELGERDRLPAEWRSAWPVARRI